ncbi:hypothetical protein [Nocardiopsis sp. JB363]|uniref:hypothetical protein n=1 Tax=Nocardiopsis sp. JB363 TaxID=1434837 RepID=UPI00190E88DA|nr:hypothetical protein [Nocardiopsis sp. JB363]
MDTPRYLTALREHGTAQGRFLRPRRMAQETMVHAWDGLDAIGRSEPLPADMAADGVDEFLTYFLGLPAEPVGPVGTVLLTGTDALKVDGNTEALPLLIHAAETE